VAFYFCINSNKHDNEMTTEMSDYMPHNPYTHTHRYAHHTQIIMQYYFIFKRSLVQLRELEELEEETAVFAIHCSDRRPLSDGC